MKISKVKSAIKYLVSLAIGFGILWYLFKDFDFEKNWSKFQNANYWWIALSIVISWLSHWLRAFRWKLLIDPLGYNLSVARGFMAVMIGYLANLIFPRMGEVSRCAVLKKTDDIPMTTSIGTVVAERLLDLIMLALLTASVLVLQFDIVYEFFSSLIVGKFDGLFNMKSLSVLLVISLAVTISGFIVWRKYKDQMLNSKLGTKINAILKEVAQGFTSVLKIENKISFWGSTLLIWFLYYLMSYVVIFSLKETEHLGLLAGLSVLVAGGIGMSAPVQGGVGTYHFLVMGLLALYGISNDDGIIFAFILHSSQTISVIIVGLISLMVNFLIVRKAKIKNAIN